jgi:hypothetical protein
MLDAMSIRQEWSYDSKTKTRSGGVDLGNGSPESDDTSNLASEAMVFMITGLSLSLILALVIENFNYFQV